MSSSNQNPTNQNATSQLVFGIISLILSEAPVAIAEIVKLKGLLNLSPNVADNLKKLFDDTIAVDQDTIDSVNAWMTANGFPTVS